MVRITTAGLNQKIPTSYPDTTCMRAHCANDPIMNSVGSNDLNLPILTLVMQKVKVFKEILKPLLSISVLANKCCEIIFRRNNMKVADAKNTVLLTGDRDPESGSLLVHITQSQTTMLMTDRKRILIHT